jgi:hypothetical protein
MKTFKDFLEWYNNLDVEPFVMVVERLRGYYFERGIDIFKINVLVPGLARQMLLFVTQTIVLVVSLHGEHFVSVVHVQVFGYV